MKKRLFLISIISVLIILASILAGCDNPSGGGSLGGSLGTPASPTGVSASAKSSSAIGISWTAVSNAEGYYVYSSSSATGNFDRVGSPKEASAEHSGLSASKTYYYKVSSYNKNGESAQSATVSATTQQGGDSSTPPPSPAKPAAPTGLTASHINECSIALKWNAVSGATSYIVYSSTAFAGPYTQVAEVTGLNRTQTGLGEGVTRFYKVSAKNSEGEGDQSTALEAKTEIPKAFIFVSDPSGDFYYVDSSLTAGKVSFYTFTATAGELYMFAWLDADRGSGSLTDPVANIKVGLRKKGEASTYIEEPSDDGSLGGNTTFYMAGESGDIVVEVWGSSGGNFFLYYE